MQDNLNRQKDITIYIYDPWNTTRIYSKYAKTGNTIDGWIYFLIIQWQSHENEMNRKNSINKKWYYTQSKSIFRLLEQLIVILFCKH